LKTNQPELLAQFRSRLTALLVAYLCKFSLVASAQHYVQISGELHIDQSTWKVGEEQPEASKHGHTNGWSVSFVCTVGTNEWELVGNFARNAAVKWFFDGTNVYSSIQTTREPDPRFANNKAIASFFPPLEQVRSNLTISVHMTPGGYPLGDVSENVPWLAFCSGTFLKRSDRIIPLPVAIVGHAGDAFGYADKTKNFDDELGLPEKVELFTSKALFEASAKAFWKDRPACIPKADFADGLLKFEYSVMQSTNFSGWTFPLAFSFAGVHEEFPGYLRSHSGTGRIVAIRNASKPKGVFDPSLNQTVVDWRFEDKAHFVNGIIYQSTNDFLQPMEDALLQETFAKTAERNAKGHAHRVAEKQQGPK
jgi:hypothetical protein